MAARYWVIGVGGVKRYSLSGAQASPAAAGAGGGAYTTGAWQAASETTATPGAIKVLLRGRSFWSAIEVDASAVDGDGTD